MTLSDSLLAQLDARALERFPMKTASEREAWVDEEMDRIAQWLLRMWEARDAETR
jgi:hypothetical protein